MGYYINAHGTITMPRSLEAEALNGLKMLNYDHDAKRGGIMGNPEATFATRWYSWMPERWHEQVESVDEVLELLGFEITKSRQAGLNVYTLTYDNKTGQEDVFLNRLAEYAQVDIEVVGEDGQRWKWANAKAGAPLMHLAADVTYRPVGTVASLIHKEDEMMKKARAMYA
jgi:hypothetical protein